MSPATGQVVYLPTLLCEQLHLEFRSRAEQRRRDPSDSSRRVGHSVFVYDHRLVAMVIHHDCHVHPVRRQCAQTRQGVSARKINGGIIGIHLDHYSQMLYLHFEED